MTKLLSIVCKHHLLEIKQKLIKLSVWIWGWVWRSGGVGSSDSCVGRERHLAGRAGQLSLCSSLSVSLYDQTQTREEGAPVCSFYKLHQLPPQPSLPPPSPLTTSPCLNSDFNSSPSEVQMLAPHPLQLSSGAIVSSVVQHYINLFLSSLSSNPLTRLNF